MPPENHAARFSYDDEVDVVVVGCGPVGALVANLLGGYGARTLVVERDASPHGQTRAFTCDDESLRICQLAGLVELVKRGTTPCDRIDCVGSDGRLMAEVALGELDYGSGYAPLHFLDQPTFEEVLRGGLARFEHVTLLVGHELSALSQDADGVTLRVRDTATREERGVRARYVLGCDGGRSVTRTLSGVGLSLDTYGEPWLSVCGDAPSSALRFSGTRFVCDWRRPTFVTCAALGTYRMEFMLHAEETPAEMERLDTIARMIEPYVEPARFTVRRAAVHTFQNTMAETWRAGRVLLLGDAAHQLPPFLGAGLASGLRDAANVAWKVALVARGEADPSLLDSYERERRPHVEATADASARLGRLFLARSPRLTRMRDAVLRSIHRVPRMRRLLSNVAFKPIPAYERGFLAGWRRGGAAGVLFPQPRVGIVGEEDHFALDAVLGADFAVVGPGVTRAMVDDPAWAGVRARFVRVVRAGRAEEGEEPADGDEHDALFEVVDLDGALEAWFARHGASWAVVRPDRFVYAVFTDGDGSAIGRELTRTLRGGAASA